MTWHDIINILYWLVLIFVSLQIIQQYTISSRASAWLFTIFVIPVFGVLLYYTFGSKRRKRKHYQKKLQSEQLEINQVSKNIDEQAEQPFSKMTPQYQPFNALANMVRHESGHTITTGNNLKLLHNGEEKFDQLLEDIAQAKTFIHLEYYIFRADEVGQLIVDQLLNKAKEGVKIRLLLDDYGCLRLNKKILQKLRDGGIDVAIFAKIKLLAFTERLNYRNHRKIVIIDGTTGYIGGINVGNEYHNEYNDTYWRDTHLKITGSAVTQLNHIFTNDWKFCIGEDIEHKSLDEEFSYDQSSPQWVQIMGSGPDSPQPTIQFAILQAIHQARKEILITTPYFVPNPATMKALKIMALAGVSVKLLVPEQSDSWMADTAAGSFYDELLLVDVKIFKYTRGFVHAKTMVVDGLLSVLGTSNFDERSFELNFEVNALIYDQDFANQLKTTFEQDLTDSIPLDANSINKKSALQTLLEKTARLVSPIL